MNKLVNIPNIYIVMKKEIKRSEVIEYEYPKTE